MKTLWISIVVVLLAVASAIGISCSGCNGSSGAAEKGPGESPSAASQPGAQAAAPAKTIDPATVGSVKGIVRFEGEAPAAKPILMTAECSALHSASVPNESFVVNPNKTLANVLVRVKSGLEGYKFPVPKDPVVLDQHGCMYVPHVVAVQVGQTLEIRTSDPTTHNINSSAAKRNMGFNKAMVGGAAPLLARFKSAELMIPIKCDIHPWMSAYCSVLDNPLFAVSNDKGEFEIGGIPPGQYTLEALHESGASKTLNVEIAPKETKSVEFSFQK
jgi:plastocyanin